MSIGLTQKEQRLELIHRVIVSDPDYPKEYAVMITNRRSIFSRQKKTRNAWVLRQEMRFGTALVTDITPKTLDDYSGISLEDLACDPENLTIPHASVTALSIRPAQLERRKRDFFVWMVMKRQKEIFRVYNFEMKYRNAADREGQITFSAVPLGVYFKPKRQFQTRETILREYAFEILDIYKRVLPPTVIRE